MKMKTIILLGIILIVSSSLQAVPLQNLSGICLYITLHNISMRRNCRLSDHEINLKTDKPSLPIPSAYQTINLARAKSSFSDRNKNL
jgi:hypothetical protein